MERIYLDNAATTPIDPVVIDLMTDLIKENFGNPSSIHHFGRKAKAEVEKSRKRIAQHFNASVGEIFFTSGGTESNNMALKCSVSDLGVTRIITSPVEHHCILQTIERLEKDMQVKVEMIEILPTGEPDIESLEKLLKTSPDEKTLVSLMHANNEVGAIANIEKVGHLCREAGAFFHSDTVQSVAHFQIDLQTIPADFISGAAHKFNGPKGTGFLYINNDLFIRPYIHGGGQERNMRAGTENVYGIAGMAKALDIAVENMVEHRDHILGLRRKLKNGLQEMIPEVSFNGPQEENSLLYTILSVNFPENYKSEMLVFNLDIHGIAASGGSACSSGANQTSHVISHIRGEDKEGATIRFSFSHLNTDAEIDEVLERVGKIFKVERVTS